MNALPALSAIATAAVRRQFDATPEPLQTRATTPSWRVGLAALLDRASHGGDRSGHDASTPRFARVGRPASDQLAPVGPRPAH